MLTRREMLGLGLGAAAAMLAFPGALIAAVDLVRPHLDIALKAERWIRGTRIETPHGVTWPADPTNAQSVKNELYNGMPGVVLFYLELYHATGDRLWLDEAQAGANELIIQLPMIDASGDWGLYTGLGGAAFVLEEVHRASGEGRYRDAAVRAVETIHTRAVKAGAGVAWTDASAKNDIISGSAGIGLLLLWADRQMGHASSKALARAVGYRLLEVGEPANGGIKWGVTPTNQTLYPNFSHGTAGVSYLLSTMYQATGERAFLDGALAGARYLRAVANTDGNGFKVFHKEGGDEELFYLSWCHGPAGTSRLFYQLAQVTQDDRWLGTVRRAARAIMSSGVPEQRTPGFWNNISQCCGNCGVGEYFLTLNRIMPDPAYAAMTQRVAADTLRRATAAATDGGGTLKWIQAENRTDPDVLIAQTGFMQGAAGVGTFFLHMDASRVNRGQSRIVWPDTPFLM